MSSVKDILARPGYTTGCSGCGSTGTGPHACPGGLQYEFDIFLMSIPFDKKWGVIKVIREIAGFTMTLTDIHKLVEPVAKFEEAHPQKKATPGVLFKSAVSKDEAFNIALRLEEAGAVVDLC